jgi:hypothetical protein
MKNPAKLLIALVLILAIAVALVNCRHADPPGPVPPATAVVSPPQVLPARIPANASQTIQNALGPILVPTKVFVQESVVPKLLSPSSVLEQTRNDIHLPDYVFTLVPGVEYCPIWYRVQQMDLKYIRLK